MAIIYLRHPVHGAKVATMEMEAVADEANGWARYDPRAGATPTVAPAVEAEPVAPAALPDTIHNAMEPRRRGRPRKE